MHPHGDQNRMDFHETKEIAVSSERLDPELNRELDELVEWLIDVYVWKQQQARTSGRSEGIDKSSPPVTI
jgi:hypothetical protein